MKEIAYLEVNVKTNPLGKREAVNYKWIGESPYLEITGVLLADLGYSVREPAITFGPYRLLFVEYQAHRDISIYVRKDRLGALRVALYKATRLLDLIYRRFVITLAVWNLAEFDRSKIPSWQDVKALKRFTKK